MTKNIEKPFLKALKGEISNIPPVWLMRQAGRYLPEYMEIRNNLGGFLDLCYNPKQACEVTLQPIRRFGFDAAILFSDILVVPHALGQNLTFVQGEGPRLDPIRDEKSLSKLSIDNFHNHLAPVYETVERVRASLPPETALIGFSGAPWTVATYMVEGQGSKDYGIIKKWIFQDPIGFKKLIDILVEQTASYLIMQVKAGAEVLQIFDSWAGVLPEDAFDQWVIEPTTKLVKLIRKEYPDVPIIGFPRGAGLKYSEYVEKTGVSAVGLDTMMPVQWAADHLQTKVPVQGNMDPQILLAGGDIMKKSVNRIINTLSKGPYIFNLGHGIIKETPPEHVSQLMDLIRQR